MAPTKVLIDQNQQQTKLQQKTITTKTIDKVLTRSQANFPKKVTTKDMTKRKADQLSPPKGKLTKRSALYDRGSNITTKPNNLGEAKKVPLKKPVIPASNNQKQKEITKNAVVQPKVSVYVDLKSILTSKSDSSLYMVLWTKLAPFVFALKEHSQTPFLNSPNGGSFPDVAVSGSNKENIDITVKNQKKQVVVHIDSSEKPSENKFEALQKIKNTDKLATKFRRSLDANQDKIDESFYTTALEEVGQESDESSRILSPVKRSTDKGSKKVEETKKEGSPPKVPPGVEDFDKENLLDPVQVSDYAMEIFEYMKRREKCFIVEDYMPRQVVITKWMRAVLIDWMVDVQENFELNHETLYLGVKITDIYLDKVVVAKEILQLIGATALFLAAKYEERMPPLIDDFIYICENAFTREDMIKMELNVFKVIEFSLGIPLSYRFLRRFARCCKATMPTLTLARYILELSLMEYHMIFYSESKIASAALYMALRMKGVSGWTPTLEYYSGYKLSEFMSYVLDLNAMLHRKPKEQLKTIRNKYSHKIFFEVAKTPLMDDEELKNETFDENKENEAL